jgi:phosphomannomutase
MQEKIFKAYDIRGKYPQEINEDAASEITEGLGGYFGKKSKIIIGKDVRLSSSSLYGAVINGFKKSKIKIIKIGLATTPMFYFLVNKLKANGGVMVTASHNPKNYNGMKVVGKRAMPVSGTEIFKNLKIK